MTQFKEQFEALLNEKKLPAKYQEIQGGNHLYRFQFRISEDRILIVEVIIQDSDKEYFDVQVIYRHVHVLNDYSKQNDALSLINELNGMRTGYYHLYLAGDGEIYLRNLMRIGHDPYPLYETIVVGSGIARNLQADFEKKLGPSAKI
ncbi:hypothetical protein HZY91_00040 [Facklamia sp. DSM 111018]|uniref:Histidine kinase n=1 Tax=Facklamia lactis TaxID=2749967 RepID=A0ABS0LPH3_9LACT|nr:hypothetical protein [Facklamia lactis]MBG9980044.1 hypothetical protein [Facklamia lactis]MBG9985276.1 hypothetical protein [Facklamia lactis]